MMNDVEYEWKRPPGAPDTSEGEDAREGDTAHIGRMMPIDPGVGPGGTIVGEATSDVASGGAGRMEWGDGIETRPHTGVVESMDDTDPPERS